MTAAICLECGEFKFGAWTRCPHGGFEPSTTEEQARSIVLSDPLLKEAELEQISSQIQDEVGPAIPEELVQQWAGMIERTARKLEASREKRRRDAPRRKAVRRRIFNIGLLAGMTVMPILRLLD